MDEHRTAIVTGASGGIGRAVAIAFGELGWTVALGARRLDELEETAQLVVDAGGSALAHPLDVCNPESMDGFLDACGAVDILVNNAGIAYPGTVHELDDEWHRTIIETNLVGPLLLTKRVVAALRRDERSGEIVFISSDVTHHPRPHLGTYTVSKAGLEALAEVLGMECEGHGIRSTTVRVGPTLTGFGDAWDAGMFDEIFPVWQRFGIQRHFATMQPADVARAVVAAVTAPAHMWVPVIEVQPHAPREPREPRE